MTITLNTSCSENIMVLLAKRFNTSCSENAMFLSACMYFLVLICLIKIICQNKLPSPWHTVIMNVHDSPCVRIDCQTFNIVFTDMEICSGREVHITHRYGIHFL